MLTTGQLIILLFAYPCFTCLIGYMIGSKERKHAGQKR